MKQIRSLHRQGGWITLAAAAIAGGAALIGGSKAASAAKSAANTQAQSGREALAQNQQFFDQTRSDLSPYRQLGNDAMGSLSSMMGYSQPPQAGGVAQPGGGADYQGYLQQNPDIVHHWQNSPQERAAYPNIEDYARSHYETYGRNEGRELPGQPQGQPVGQPGAQSSYGMLATQPQANFNYSNLPTDYTAKEFNFQADPGYQFRLNEGNKAIGRATSTGALPSGGATLKALTRFGQDYASGEYGNAYNRFSSDRMFDYGTFADNYGRQANERGFDYGVFGDNYNRQAANMDRPFNYATTLAGMGQNAANMGAQSAGQFAGMNSQTITGMGNAQAAGRVGSANAWNNALGQVGNTAMDAMTLRTLMNGRNMNSPQNSGLQYFDTTALPSRRY
jgi:hypothetical protein